MFEIVIRATIRSYILYSSCYFSFIRIIHPPEVSKKKHAVALGLFLPISLAVTMAGELFMPLSVPVMYVAFIAIMQAIYRSSFGTTYAASTIALGINYALYLISACLVAAVCTITKIKPFPSGALEAVIKTIPVILVFIANYFLFRIKRFRSGMPFIEDRAATFAGVLISSMILAFMYDFDGGKASTFTKVSFAIIMIGAFLLYIWWRLRLKKKYIDELQKQELNYLRAYSKSQEEKISMLADENDKLASIVHRDNKIIPSMELSLREYILNSNEDNKETGEKLLEELHNMSEGRKGIIRDYEQAGQPIQLTGTISIDNVLNYMNKKAAGLGVELKTDVTETEEAVKAENIDLNDITTILADILENAIIACAETDIKQVMAHIGILNKKILIRVFDSGSPFEISLFEKIGKVQETTHKDDGGSGIGLKTLFEIKEKYHSSIIIDEISSDGIITKSVSFIFDKHGQFIVRSYRAEEIRKECKRKDLLIQNRSIQ